METTKVTGGYPFPSSPAQASASQSTASASSSLCLATSGGTLGLALSPFLGETVCSRDGNSYPRTLTRTAVKVSVPGVYNYKNLAEASEVNAGNLKDFVKEEVGDHFVDDNLDLILVDKEQSLGVPSADPDYTREEEGVSVTTVMGISDVTMTGAEQVQEKLHRPIPLNFFTPNLPVGKGAPESNILDSFPALNGASFVVPASTTVVALSTKFSTLFAGRDFNCHRTILPWVRLSSEHAWVFLERFLPVNGPVVARDLGLLLNYCIFMFDLTNISLPQLEEVLIDGYNFLHFNDTTLAPILEVTAKLLVFDGFVGASLGVDAMHMISTAASVGAATIAANDASTAYRESLGALTPLTILLNSEDMAHVSRERNVAFKPNRTVTNDHSLMAAFRELIRYDFQKFTRLVETTSRTLVLGATEREYKAYNNNPYIYFQLANREGKDTDRLVTKFLKELRELKAKKTKSRDKTSVTVQRSREEIRSVDRALLEWKCSKKLPERFLTWEESQSIINNSIVLKTDDREVDGSFKIFDRKVGPCQVINNVFNDKLRTFIPCLGLGDNRDLCTFDQIVFEDVGYNFTMYDWYKIFKNTGAIVGYGYMCLPWQLIFPDMFPPPGYLYKVEGSYSYLAYSGYCNGYAHKTEAWSTFLRHAVIDVNELSLGVEILSRAGPMACVKVYRNQRKEIITRVLALPQHLRSVLLLDINKSVNKYTNTLNMDKLVYFPVKLEEFEDALNYALDISRESLSPRMLTVYIRRRTSGLSLVTKELSKTWTVDKAHISEFAEVVYLVALYKLTVFESANNEIQSMSFNPILDFLKRKTVVVRQVLKIFVNMFKTHHCFLDVIVKNVENRKWQTVVTVGPRRNGRALVFTGVNPEDLLDKNINFSEEDIKNTIDCLFCAELQDCLGAQKFSCKRSCAEDFTHEFSLSDTELKTLRSKLSDTTNDAPGLKATKEEAFSKIPLAPFSIEVKVKYICGPPGTGKSYAIRGLATSKDVVIAPFSRLKEDYTNFIHPVTGKKTSLRFFTQHTGFNAMNHSRIFVDEYTAMPYECLAIIAFRCSADEIILVGDHRQTSLINEVEGISIPTKIDMTKLRKHELIKNFRNPSDVVIVLNTLYSYSMEATNTRVGYSFDLTTNFERYKDYTPLFFRYATAEKFGVSGQSSDKVTVRANQGATYENVCLVVTNSDKDLFVMSSMAIVALSRHRNKCVILYEDGEAGVFAGMVKSAIPDTDDKGPNAKRKSRSTYEGEYVEQTPDIVVSSKTTNMYQSVSQSGLVNSLVSNFKNLVRKQLSRFLKTHGMENQNSDDDSMPGLEDIPEEELDDSFVDANEDFVVDSTEQQISMTGENVEDNNSQMKDFDQLRDESEVIVEGKVSSEVYYQDLGKGSDPGDLFLPPNENSCLLLALSETTGWDVQDIWTKFLIALGPDVKPRIEKEGMTTNDLETFCDKFNFRCRVYTDEEVFLSIGKTGGYIGSLYFSGPKDNGHFTVNKNVSFQSLADSYKAVPILTEGTPQGNVTLQEVDDNMNSAFVVQFGSVTESKKDTKVKTVNYSPPEGKTISWADAMDLHDKSSNGQSVTQEGDSGQIPELGIKSLEYRSNNFMLKEEIPMKSTTWKDAVLGIKSLFPEFNELIVTTQLRDVEAMLMFPCNICTLIQLKAKLFWYRWFVANFTIFPRGSGNSSDGPGGDGGPNGDGGDGNDKTNKGSGDYTGAGSSSRKRTLVPTPPPLPNKDSRTNLGKTVTLNGSQIGTFTRYIQPLKGGSQPVINSLPHLSVVEPRKIEYEPLAASCESFIMMARLFTDPIRVTEFLVEIKDLEPFPYISLEQSSFDSFKLLAQDFATSDEGDLMLTNQEALGYMEKDFGCGVFDLTKLDNLNPRGHLKRNKEKLWSMLAISPGVTYFKNNLNQSLACLQSRYLTRKLVTTFDSESVKKANEVADLFYFEHMFENFDCLNEQDLYMTTLESEKSMKQKNYESQVKFSEDGDIDVRFTMKDIFKPFKTKIDVFKVGQGISAWSRDTQTIFQTAFRVINKLFIGSLQPHVVFDNGIDEVTLMNRVNALFFLLPDVCLNGVIDATACDSGQNKFTQKIERRILERMGVREEFLDWYYWFREEYVLKGYGVVAKITGIKTSGEPATLLNNTIMMAALMNYLVRGEGPSVLVIKGDDGLKRQANVFYDDRARNSLKRYLKMDFKVDIDVPITFCGYFLYDRYLVPDLIRKVFKILGHKFRDFEHFQEYQESLRDWILNINKLGVNDVCYITSRAYDLEEQYCYLLFHSIVSLSHIRRKQFEEVFVFREFDWSQDFLVSEKWSLKSPWYSGYN